MLAKTLLFCLSGILIGEIWADNDWWKHAVIYQVYPRSFKDSDNDGKGDLRGVIEKLNYLANTKVSAVWFSPIYPSPGVDAGYDISDYRDINPEYGTLDEFKELLAKAHKLGIKVILDLVPNHSSDQHEWFKRSLKKEEPYTDYYVWKDADENGNPPNNWDSYFGGPTWTWSPERNQFYFHQFHKAQPDFNYRNRRVIQEMKDIMLYWLDMGVDGFRVDVMPSLFEHPDFPKEDQWVHRSDLPETYLVLHEWRDLLDKYHEERGGDTRIMMTESYSPPEKLFLYYGNATHDGAHFTFNFWFITDLNASSDAHEIKAVIDKWFGGMRKGDTANWVLGNHDQNRVATRFGTKRVDGLAMLTAILPGVTVTYNGEEIGMENGKVTFKEGQDPQGCNAKEDGFQSRSRDFERTPFHWDDSANAGFNEGAPTWLPVSKKFTENNLKDQMERRASHYKVYKMALELKRETTIRYGSWEVIAFGSNVLGVVRKHDGTSCVLLVNLFGHNETVNLTSFDGSLPSKLAVKIPSSLSGKAYGDVLSAENVSLDPFEAVVLKSFKE